MRNKFTQKEIDLIKCRSEILSSMNGYTITLDRKKVQAELDRVKYNIRKTEKDRVNEINKLIQKQMKEKQIDLKGRTIKEVRDDGVSLTVEFETKWEPKAGDICESGDGAIFIYKEGSEEIADFFAAIYEDKFYAEGSVYDKGFRPATREERCKFFERLVKEGYKWNAKKLELKWEPKDGDFVYWKTNTESGVCILKGNYDGNKKSVYHYANYSLKRKLLEFDSSIGTMLNRSDRGATDLERRILLDALKKAGKTWNAEKKCVEKSRWRAKEGGEYDFVYIGKNGGDAYVCKLPETGFKFDDDHYNFGNYYNPATNDAQKAADRINAIFNENK